MPENKVTIKLPRPLYNKIEKVIEESSFRSVTDFVICVLRDVISAYTGKEDSEKMTKKEVSIVREKLKSLGYL